MVKKIYYWKLMLVIGPMSTFLGSFIILQWFISITALAALACLNLNRCGLSDDGFEKISGEFNYESTLKLYIHASNSKTGKVISSRFFSIPFSAGLTNLKGLSLGFNNITDACLIHLKGDLIFPCSRIVLLIFFILLYAAYENLICQIFLNEIYDA